MNQESNPFIDRSKENVKILLSELETSVSDRQVKLFRELAQIDQEISICLRNCIVLMTEKKQRLEMRLELIKRCREKLKIRLENLKQNTKQNKINESK